VSSQDPGVVVADVEVLGGRIGHPWAGRIVVQAAPGIRARGGVYAPTIGLMVLTETRKAEQSGPRRARGSSCHGRLGSYSDGLRS
jgi:hypothetical protein